MSADSSQYRRAGVDIDAQDRALKRIKKLVAGTAVPGVLSELGGFGGLFQPDLAGRDAPVLVASADGVGTKLEVAKRANDWTTVGRDLVNHCVNDILVQGAEPLFFLDYVGAGVLEPDVLVDLVRGIADGCRANGCALLGGETAEMPGMYQPGDHELVGFVVGLVERARAARLDGSQVRAGDLILGLPSDGLHTNGYTLARRVVFDVLGLGIDDPVRWQGETIGTARTLLLAPHRTYLPPLRPLLDHAGLHALAHVTGGGITDNLPRVLPKAHHALIRVGAWAIPPFFHVLQHHGEVDDDEMFRVFNMGIGMLVVIDPAAAAEIMGALKAAGQSSWPIGTVGEGGSGVAYDFPVDQSLARGAEVALP
ncbi:MAG: phosphoribosylformylglycinamidine cyclo-ligase [Acidobacteriota bacterium]